MIIFFASNHHCNFTYIIKILTTINILDEKTKKIRKEEKQRGRRRKREKKRNEREKMS